MNKTASIRAAVLTVSDTREPVTDVSGDRLAVLLAGTGAIIVKRSTVTDDLKAIQAELEKLLKTDEIDLVLTTGGTGFAPRDNTPEATRTVIRREAPGIAEAMRRETALKTPMAMLSRGIAGIAGNTLVINLPGSPKAVEECFEAIRPVLRHAVSLLRGESEHSSEQ